MKLILIGAPGSGKTNLARRLSKISHTPHLEADKIFWARKNLREELYRLTQEENWILEGHLSKHFDITFPRADKFLILTGQPKVFLLRALRRDILKLSKFWFNLKNHQKMEEKRSSLIEDLLKTREKDVFYLENLSYPSESDLKSLAEALQGTSSHP